MRDCGGSTFFRPDGTFGYGHIPYREEVAEFVALGAREAERVRTAADLTRSSAENQIRYSALPWLDFTSLSHARRFSAPDSCPRITFGKMTESAGRRSMPVSIHVSHAVVDGLHVGRYVEQFQELMNAEA